MTDAAARRWGAQSMTAPLREVLVHRPGVAFGAAFDDPAHEFLHPVDLAVAQREHDAFVDLLVRLGVQVHFLEAEPDTPDLLYTFDPLLVTDAGAIPLRPGKPTRVDEPALLEAWTSAAGIPTVGRIEAPGTIEGGDTFWLRPDLLCIGRSRRTNADGAAQLAALVGGDVRIFDVPSRGAELVHLLSVISPVTDSPGRRSTSRSCQPASAELLSRAGHPHHPGAGRRVPDPRLQRPRRAPGSADHGRGQPPRPSRPGGRRLRGPHLPGDGDRDQWLGWSDLHDPPYTPDRLTVRTSKEGPMFKEFRDFILRGNVIDLAVGIVIGAAFGAVITSFVGDILTPLLGLLNVPDFSTLSFEAGKATVELRELPERADQLRAGRGGDLLLRGQAHERHERPHEEARGGGRATTKSCPFCATDIPVAATRCPHCTSQLA